MPMKIVRGTDTYACVHGNEPSRKVFPRMQEAKLVFKMFETRKILWDFRFWLWWILRLGCDAAQSSGMVTNFEGTYCLHLQGWLYSKMMATFYRTVSHPSRLHSSGRSKLVTHFQKGFVSPWTSSKCKASCFTLFSVHTLIRNRSASCTSIQSITHWHRKIKYLKGKD